jgi:hypothetical protein
MRRYRRVPTFEQLETRLPLAADACDADEAAAAETPSLLTEASDASSAGQSAVYSALALDSQSSDEEGDDEEDEQDQEEEQETDEEEQEDDEEEGEDEQDEEEDEEDEEEDEDDEEEDDEDDDDDEDDEDEDDEDETVLMTELTGTTGSGMAKLETETEGSATERELKIEITGLEQGEYDVKIGSTIVGQITVDGTSDVGRLKLSSDPDDDETLLEDDVIITGGTTVMVLDEMGQTVLMGMFPTAVPVVPLTSTAAQSAGFTADALFAADEFASSQRVENTEDGAAEAGGSQSAAVDAALADLLLAVAGSEEAEEPESTEFVGRSDQRDVAAETPEVAFDAALDRRWLTTAKG